MAERRRLGTGEPNARSHRRASKARKVADLGFAVFSADWGVGLPDTAPAYDQPPGDAASQAACAVAFARAHAAEYGGDPATMIVFGHAAGANLGALVAFARPEPTAGCLGGATLGAIDALVTWDGAWVLSLQDSDASSPPTRGSSTSPRRGRTSPITRSSRS